MNYICFFEYCKYYRCFVNKNLHIFLKNDVKKEFFAVFGRFATCGCKKIQSIVGGIHEKNGV